MQVFPTEKCQVVWQKDSTSEIERQAIIKELGKMAVEFQEAIDFTIKLSNKKPNEIKYWLEQAAKPILHYQFITTLMPKLGVC
jgi:hypothetical protein